MQKEISLYLRQHAKYASIKYFLNRIDILINVANSQSFFCISQIYILRQVFTGKNKKLRALTLIPLRFYQLGKLVYMYISSITFESNDNLRVSCVNHAEVSTIILSGSSYSKLNYIIYLKFIIIVQKITYTVLNDT